MNQRFNIGKTRGFTLIELMLAMTFLSILLLTIALTLVRIGTIYNHGIITREVNTSSRSISNELNLAMSSSGAFSVDPAQHHLIQTMSGSKVIGGRLCLSKYSYIWNYGDALSPAGTYPNPVPDPNRNTYINPAAVNLAANVVKIGSAPARYEIGLVKVADTSGYYCTPNGSGAYPKVDPTNAVELLKTGDHGLVLHYVSITTSTSAIDSLSAQQLYKVVFVLGTNNVNALTATDTGANPDVTCLAPGQTGADADYCVVQRFSIVLRVVNGVN